jgi:glycosyltransferase involved in cell wall biosynthesis
MNDEKLDNFPLYNKEKITIITPSLGAGGAEKVALNLANYYSSIGFCVDLVVFMPNGHYQSLVSDKVNLVNLNVSRTLFVFFKLRKYLRNNKNARILSVILDANIVVGLAAIGLNLICLVFRQANTLNHVENLKQPKKIIYKLLMKLTYRRANHIIANSDDTKADLCRYGIVEFSQATVIRNPVLPPDYIKLKQQKVDDLWLAEPDKKVILTVGRLHRQKNFLFLISVFKALYQDNRSARLIIVGEGKEKERLLIQIRLEGLQEVVKLIPFQSNIYPYYENADVFALTSEWEGFGNVLVEALSVGLPVVSTNCPGGPKTILENGKYGTLVDVGDKQAYISALIKALDSPTKSQRTINYALRFSVESVAKDYLKVMQ